MRKLKLRKSEWVLVTFFAYIALLGPFFRERPRMSSQPLFTLVVVCLLLGGIAWAENTRFSQIASMIRDWLPMVLTLIAFREMELFVPLRYNSQLERAWIGLDDRVLGQWGLKHIVESLGSAMPTILELCYLMVYGVGSFCIIVLWAKRERRSVDRFYVVLLVGTLLCYALFPYFPSRPPRLAFPEMSPPATHDVFRRFNLFLLRKATIHSGVFPSAHVSSAFAAAWGMFLALPRDKRYGWGLLAYACLVSLATVYGRYHYAADAMAGFAISLVAAAACFLLRREPE